MSNNSNKKSANNITFTSKKKDTKTNIVESINETLSEVKVPKINKSNVSLKAATDLKIKGKTSELDKFNIKNNKKGLNKKKSNMLSIKTDKSFNAFKVIVIIALIALLIALLLFGIKAIKNKNENNKVIINDETFLTQVNEVLSEKDKYIGKEITLSGIYGDYDYNGKVYKMIYRTTPGSSGNNGIAAFDIYYGGEVELESGDWIKITGILNSYYDEVDEEEYLAIDVDKLEKIEEGNKFVTK